MLQRKPGKARGVGATNGWVKNADLEKKRSDLARLDLTNSMQCAPSLLERKQPLPFRVIATGRLASTYMPGMTLLLSKEGAAY